LQTFKQEYEKRLYRIGPYYWAKTSADIPVQMFVLCLFAVLALPMTGLCPNPGRAMMFLGYMLLTSNVFASFGYFVSTLANDPMVVIIIGNGLMLPAMLVGGFFINTNSVPDYYIALESISTFNYAFQAFAKCVYYNQPLECEDDEVCVYETGDDVLKYLGIELSFFYYVYILIAQSVFLRVMGHIVLYFRFKALPTCEDIYSVFRKWVKGLSTFRTYILSLL